ncbi:MAG: hypothetical protein KKF74_00520 [Nanoarchaeota archaeon]|nr:hypothetical protein [Nanoarchaeota archaeon]
MLFSEEKNQTNLKNLEFRLFSLSINYNPNEALPPEIASLVVYPQSPIYPCEHFLVGVYNQRHLFEKEQTPLFVSLDYHGQAPKFSDNLLSVKKRHFPKKCDYAILNYTFKDLISEVIIYRERLKESSEIEMKIAKEKLFGSSFSKKENPKVMKKRFIEEMIQEKLFSKIKSISYGCCGCINPNTGGRYQRVPIKLDDKIKDYENYIIETERITLNGQKREYKQLIIILNMK